LEQSSIKDIEIKVLLKDALTNKIDDKNIYMKDIDTSYYYEGYVLYSMEDV
jgi:cell filamentation protein